MNRLHRPGAEESGVPARVPVDLGCAPVLPEPGDLVAWVHQPVGDAGVDEAALHLGPARQGLIGVVDRLALNGIEYPAPTIGWFGRARFPAGSYSGAGGVSTEAALMSAR